MEGNSLSHPVHTPRSPSWRTQGDQTTSNISQNDMLTNGVDLILKRAISKWEKKLERCANAISHSPDSNPSLFISREETSPSRDDIVCGPFTDLFSTQYSNSVSSKDVALLGYDEEIKDDVKRQRNGERVCWSQTAKFTTHADKVHLQPAVEFARKDQERKHDADSITHTMAADKLQRVIADQVMVSGTHLDMPDSQNFSEICRKQKKVAGDERLHEKVTEPSTPSTFNRVCIDSSSEQLFTDDTKITLIVESLASKPNLTAQTDGVQSNDSNHVNLELVSAPEFVENYNNRYLERSDTEIVENILQSSIPAKTRCQTDSESLMEFDYPDAIAQRKYDVIKILAELQMNELRESYGQWKQRYLISTGLACS
ncbi:uncharacterized protein [Diadema setosum]|uniref:uncharacterized protein n=1 Tax=Diadema setosum TaxID=31175 RepID=UPI003B3BD10B